MIDRDVSVPVEHGATALGGARRGGAVAPLDLLESAGHVARLDPPRPVSGTVHAVLTDWRDRRVAVASARG